MPTTHQRAVSARNRWAQGGGGRSHLAHRGAPKERAGGAGG